MCPAFFCTPKTRLPVRHFQIRFASALVLLVLNSSGWVFAIIAVIGLSFSLPCEAQLTLDQSFTSPANLGANINECCAFVGQTYTAGMTGVLSGVVVDVHSISISPNIFPLHVAIRTVSGGVPTTTVLGEVTLGASDLSQVIVFPESIPHGWCSIRYCCELLRRSTRGSRPGAGYMVRGQLERI